MIVWPAIIFFLTNTCSLKQTYVTVDNLTAQKRVYNKILVVIIVYVHTISDENGNSRINITQ